MVPLNSTWLLLLKQYLIIIIRINEIGSTESAEGRTEVNGNRKETESGGGRRRNATCDKYVERANLLIRAIKSWSSWLLTSNQASGEWGRESLRNIEGRHLLRLQTTRLTSFYTKENMLWYVHNNNNEHHGKCTY